MQPITQAEIAARLAFDNPWWESSQVDSRFSELPRRAYFEEFNRLVTDHSINRAVVLMGPRRVGKTVLLHHSIAHLLEQRVNPRHILYLSLETPVYTGLSLGRIVALFTGLHNHHRQTPLYFIFDEVQYHSNWEVHLKSLVDSYPHYRFIVSGSAAAALRLKSQESGAGRFTDFLLPPLTFSEYLNFTGEAAKLIVADQPFTGATTPDINALNRCFIDYLNFGGYPEAVFSSTIRKNAQRFIKSDIIDKVLLRDLPNLYGINDIQELNKLFTMIAYNTGQEISYEELAQSSGVAKNTIKKYIEYLEAAFLIKVVHRVDQNAKKFIRATQFKAYLTNPSMRAALFGSIDETSNAIGPLVETAIVTQYLHGPEIKNLYYARWKSSTNLKAGEVDIVFIDERNLKPHTCIEIKWSDQPYDDTRKIASLLTFIKHNSSTTPAVPEQRNTAINQHTLQTLVTTKTVSDHKEINGYPIKFVVSALYAYNTGVISAEQRLNHHSFAAQ